MGTSMQKVLKSVQDLFMRACNQVEVQAFAGSTMVTIDNKKCTPVMVRVAAPPPPPPAQRTPVDVVAVLNTSNSMDGMRAQMKEAMKAVIEKLDSKDRLSLVTLEEEHTAGMELVYMEESVRRTAVQKIETMTDRIWSAECSVTETVLHKVSAQMMKTRASSEQRLRCVMLLSCVQDQVQMTQWMTETRKHEFQFHTFDLGVQEQYDGGRFNSVAEARAGAGAYHCIHANTSITHAFGNFVAGLKTVVATSVSVKFSLKADHASAQGLSILPLGQAAGGHCGSDGDHHIHIADMHACEKKSFMLYLHSATHQEVAVSTSTVKKILRIEANYHQQACSSTAKPQPCLLHGNEIIKNEEVAAEVVRSLFVKHVRETIVQQTTEAHAKVLQEKWEAEIKSSDVYKVASSTKLVKHIEEDLAKMVVVQGGGRLHMVSWLSCHWWQRTTTTTCMSHYDYAFVSETKPAAAAGCWWQQPWLLRVVGLLILVLVVTLLGRLIISAMWRPPLLPLRPTALDVAQHHPHWAAMETELDAVLRGAKQDTTTTFFKDKGASARDMNQQIEQYLYMAILYASVLRARYDVTSAFSQNLVRRHAETYIQSMLTRTKTGVLPTLQVSSTEATTKAMSQFLYSTIVQTEVLVTISPPRPVVIGEIEKLREENKTLRDEIADLKKQIADLQREKNSCCKRANECEQKANNADSGWGL